MSSEASTEGAAFISGPWPLTIAWLICGFVCLGTARNVYGHLKNFSRPDLQSHVLRIIMVGPIYAFGAALCLCLSEEGVFFVKSVRDIWEAVVIYCFLTLVIEYMGGEHMCLHSISQQEEAVPHLFPLDLCLPPIPTGSMIRVPKIGALQFVAVKPLVALVSIIVFACGEYENRVYQWTLFFIYNVSYSVALYALYLIYTASHDHQALKSKRPLLKFVSVKMIVFLTFWQALLLPFAPLPGSSGKWEDLILAVEMFVFSILMNIAFNWREFHGSLRADQDIASPGGMPPSNALGQKVVLDLIDLGDGSLAAMEEGAKASGAQDASKAAATAAATVAPEPIGARKLAQNARAAFCPRDIIMDASANFSMRYQQHVRLESAQEYDEEAQESQKPGTNVDIDFLTDNPGSPAAPSDMRSRLAASKPFQAVRSLGGKTFLGRLAGTAPKEGGAGPDPSLEQAGAETGPLGPLDSLDLRSSADVPAQGSGENQFPSTEAPPQPPGASTTASSV